MHLNVAYWAKADTDQQYYSQEVAHLSGYHYTPP